MCIFFQRFLHLILIQTLMSVLPKMDVTWMPLVLTPKDLTTAPVKMDLKATGKIARVRLSVLNSMTTKS